MIHPNGILFYDPVCPAHLRIFESIHKVYIKTQHDNNKKRNTTQHNTTQRTQHKTQNTKCTHDWSTLLAIILHISFRILHVTSQPLHRSRYITAVTHLDVGKRSSGLVWHTEVRGVQGPSEPVANHLERETHRDTQRERDTDRERDTHREREREREKRRRSEKHLNPSCIAKCSQFCRSPHPTTPHHNTAVTQHIRYTTRLSHSTAVTQYSSLIPHVVNIFRPVFH